MTPSSDIAFTPTIKAIQSRKGSRASYAQQEASGGWETLITEDLRAFIAAQNSVFLATASADGQPYVQHRGGPAGFLKVLDDRTIGFVDFAGNQQFITAGNLAENGKAYLFLIDYARRQRVKIWGTARLVEGEAELTTRLMPKDYRARAEQVILFSVAAWDANCPQHIPQRLEAADVATVLAKKDAEITNLKAELEMLRSTLGQTEPETSNRSYE